MLRSILGFSTGVVVFAIWEKTNSYQLDERLAFVIEMLCVIFVFLFVSAVAQSSYSLFAPLVFALVVLVFAQELGPISSFLRQKIFVVLWMLSYSIYLVHLLVERKIVGFVNYMENISGHQLVTKVPHGDEIIDVLGLNYTQGNLWACVYLVLVVGVATLTYRCIEVPSRLWFRKQAQVERP